jgi:hypothetical protein
VQDPNPKWSWSISPMTIPLRADRGKTYYFRVRPGVVKDGVTYYGSWSNGYGERLCAQHHRA